MAKPRVYIFTDGSCDNYLRGAWAASLRWMDQKLYISGNEADTTNNRMELTAVIKALEQLTVPCKITLTSDSKYVLTGIKNVSVWKRHDWTTHRGTSVSNRDLWEKFLKLRQGHLITCVWIKGHAGHAENEQVDSLAQQRRQELPVK